MDAVILVNADGCEHTVETKEDYERFIAAGWVEKPKPKAKRTLKNEK